MIVYQFCILSSGEIKISEAEYTQATSRKGKSCYRKIKDIKKGVKKPGFPHKLYYFGENKVDGKFYTTNIDNLYSYCKNHLESCNEEIKILKIRLKQFQTIAKNLKKMMKKGWKNYETI